MSDFGSPIVFILATFTAYVLGSFNGAQVLHHLARSRWPRHITRIGTKNAGAQNVWVNIGKRSGVLVFLIDFLKAASAVLIAEFLGLKGAGVLLAASFAVVGHNWPLFFHFRGGRGVASLLGIFYAFDFTAAVAGGVVSMPFVLFRFSGLTPFVFILVGLFMQIVHFGVTVVFIYVFLALVLYIRRIQATWHELMKSRRKISILISNLLYDRPTNKPPSLRDLFQ